MNSKVTEDEKNIPEPESGPKSKSVLDNSSSNKTIFRNQKQATVSSRTNSSAATGKL
jgi:hypothetical protein